MSTEVAALALWYHPPAPGLNPKHIIYAFSICIAEIVTVTDIGMRKGRK